MLIPRVRTAQYLSESRKGVLPRALCQAGSGCALSSEFSAAPVGASNARAQCSGRSAHCYVSRLKRAVRLSTPPRASMPIFLLQFGFYSVE